jgi:hypothetical protein
MCGDLRRKGRYIEDVKKEELRGFHKRGDMGQRGME